MGPLLGKPRPHSAGAAPAAALAAAALTAAPRHLLPSYLLLQHNRALSVHPSPVRPEAAMASAADHIPALRAQTLHQGMRSRRKHEQAQAAAALARLAYSTDPEHCSAIAAAGGIPILMECLGSDRVTIQREAALALMNLTRAADADSLRRCQAVTRCGVARLLRQLVASRPWCGYYAAAAMKRYNVQQLERSAT